VNAQRTAVVTIVTFIKITDCKPYGQYRQKVSSETGTPFHKLLATYASDCLIAPWTETAPMARMSRDA